MVQHGSVIETVQKSLRKYGYFLDREAVNSYSIAELTRYMRQDLLFEKLGSRHYEGITLAAEVINVSEHLKDTPMVSRLISNVLNSGNVQSAISAIFGDLSWSVRNIYAIRSHPTPVQLSKLPYAWHFDRLGMLKLFIPLHDIREGCGATMVAPALLGEVKKRRLAWIASGADPLKQDNSLELHDEQSLSLIAPAGSLILLDTDVPHRAGHVQSPNLRLLLRIDIIARGYTAL